MIKHPKYKFLEANPNPTMGQVMQEALKWSNQNETVAFEAFLFFLDELLFWKFKTFENINKNTTQAAFDLLVVHQAMGCYQSGGLAVGLFGNNPQVLVYLPESAVRIGQPEVAKAIETVKAVFPPFADFSKNDQLYCDLLNMMENPRRKTSSPQVQQLSTEAKEAYHKNYDLALDQAEIIIDPLWIGNTTDDAYHGLNRYYETEINTHVFKPGLCVRTS